MSKYYFKFLYKHYQRHNFQPINRQDSNQTTVCPHFNFRFNIEFYFLTENESEI